MTTTVRRNSAVALAAATLLATGLWWGTGGHGGLPAAADTNPATDTVAVSGVGTVQGVPDTLTATFTAHVLRPSVQAALDGEAAATRRLLAALKAHGVSGRDVQTAALQLSPHYTDHGGTSGYDASETVSAKIHPISGAGRVIAAAASASGDDISVDGLSFDVDQDDALLRAAREQAYGDAKQRAQQYADLAGRTLGRVERVSEQVDAQPGPQPYDRAAATGALAGGSATPIAAGEQPVTVTVTVTWSLAG